MSQGLHGTSRHISPPCPPPAGAKAEAQRGSTQPLTHPAPQLLRRGQKFCRWANHPCDHPQGGNSPEQCGREADTLALEALLRGQLDPTIHCSGRTAGFNRPPLEDMGSLPSWPLHRKLLELSCTDLCVDISFISLG